MKLAPRAIIPFAALACLGIVAIAGPRRSEAQSSPQNSSAQSEAGEPRATTSPDAPEAAGQSPDAAAPGAHPADSREAQGSPSNADGGKAERGKTPGREGGATEREGNAQRAGKTEREGNTEREAKTGRDGKTEHGKAADIDRLQLQMATVTGDREQPKVMYIVPWKKSDIGDLSGKPMNSLLDEALAPVDRDEFKREVMYYQAVRADASQNGAPGPGGAATAPSR